MELKTHGSCITWQTSQNIDVEDLVVAREEEKDLWHTFVYRAGGIPQKRCKTQSIVQNPRKVTE